MTEQPTIGHRATTPSSPTSTCPGGPVRVIVIHTQSPIVHHGQWESRPRRSSASCRPDGPAVMTGDFNASWWHPELRRLMRAARLARRPPASPATGCRARGRPRSGTPSFRWHPPFVRLDHALVNDGLAVARRRPTSTSPAATTAGWWSPCSELGQQRPERPAAVRQGVLVVLGHLGERAPVAVVGHEHRRRSRSPARPARPSAIVPSHTPSTASSRPSGHTTIATVRKRAAPVGDAGERGEQLGPVLGVRRVLAGEAAGVHAGRARRARRPRARCRRRRRPSPAGGGDRRRLEPGVALQRVGVLDDVGHVRPAAAAARRRRRGSSAISATLSGLADAHTSAARLTVGDGRRHRHHLGLQVGDLGQPELGEREQLVELAARERHPLGRALHLDEAGLAAGRPGAA